VGSPPGSHRSDPYKTSIVVSNTDNNWSVLILVTTEPPGTGGGGVLSHGGSMVLPSALATLRGTVVARRQTVNRTIMEAIDSSGLYRIPTPPHTTLVLMEELHLKPRAGLFAGRRKSLTIYRKRH